MMVMLGGVMVWIVACRAGAGRRRVRFERRRSVHWQNYRSNIERESVIAKPEIREKYLRIYRSWGSAQLCRLSLRRCGIWLIVDFTTNTTVTACATAVPFRAESSFPGCP